MPESSLKCPACNAEIAVKDEQNEPFLAIQCPGCDLLLALDEPEPAVSCCAC